MVQVNGSVERLSSILLLSFFGRPGFPFGFLGAGGRLPKARRGRFFIVQFIIVISGV